MPFQPRDPDIPHKMDPLYSPATAPRRANRVGILKAIEDYRRRGRPIWERLPNEPDPAWEMFVVYRDMGPKRSLDRLAVHYGKKRRAADMTQRSRVWRWHMRCLEMDAEMSRTGRREPGVIAADLNKELLHIVSAAEVAELSPEEYDPETDLTNWPLLQANTRNVEYRVGSKIMQVVEAQLDAVINPLSPKQKGAVPEGSHSDEKPLPAGVRATRTDLKDLAAAARAASLLMRAATGLNEKDGIPTSPDLIDPAKATDAELKSFMARHKAKTRAQ